MKPRPIIELLAYRRECARCGTPIDVDEQAHPIWYDVLRVEVWYCPRCCPGCNWYDR